MANDVRARASLKDDLSGPLTRIGDSWNKQAKSFATGALAASAVQKGFSLVGRAVGDVTDFLGDSVKAASNLNESLGKSQVVFGSHADAIEKWAAKGAEAFGLSKQAALEAAGTYGNLFQAFGVGQTEAAGMSQKLVELAADLASFNNTSIDEAIQALRSGLSGETEPLKRYGIALSDARMRAELLSQGYKNLGSTLTPLQKTTAAYALILKDSALAQGDFARTTDGVANKQRKVTAEIENLKAELGQNALPLEKEWLNLQSNLFRGIDFLADSLNYQNQSLERKIELTRIDIAGTTGATKAEAEHRLALLLSEQAMDEHGDGLIGLRVATDKLGAAAVSGADDLDELDDELDETARAADALDRKVGDLASSLSDELFGDAINEGHLAELKDTHKELLKQRDAAKEGSREYKILTGKIAENEQAMFDLQLQMAQKAGPEALFEFLDTGRTKLGYADGAAINYYNTLLSLYGLLGRYKDLGVIDFGRYAGKTITGFASGGHYKANEPRIVGEDGPELDIPDHSGTVVPVGSGSSGSWGGGMSGSPVVIQLTVDGRELARLVDRHLYYGQSGPSLFPRG